MTAIDTTRYTYHPGVDEVVEIDLDKVVLHGLDGQRITEESLEREALEDERRFRAGLVPGGKSLSGGSTHSPNLRVVVGESTADLVRERAAEANMSVSKWLRRLIEREVA